MSKNQQKPPLYKPIPIPHWYFPPTYVKIESTHPDDAPTSQEENIPMTKEIKQLCSFLNGWIPVGFGLIVSPLLSSIYIEELSLSIHRTPMVPIFQTIAFLWGFLFFLEENVPYVWSFLWNLIPVHGLCILFFAQYRFVTAGILFAICAGLMIAVHLLFRLELRDVPKWSCGWRKYRLVTKYLSALIINVLFLVPTLSILFRYGFEQPTFAPAEPYLQADYLFCEEQIKNHIDVLSDFEEEKWNILSIEERTELLRFLVELETEYLNIWDVRLILKELEGGALGQYVPADKAIWIDPDVVNTYDPYDIVGIVAHECRHAYQAFMLERVDWNDSFVQSHRFYRELQLWKANYENGYQDGAEDLEAYQSQPVEKDAREYSQEKQRWYTGFIKYHIS